MPLTFEIISPVYWTILMVSLSHKVEGSKRNLERPADKPTTAERKIMKMAKVITMKIALNKRHTLELVTTVDPNMTVEKLLSMLCISGFVIKAEETPIMPLPVALIHSDNVKRNLGII